jgi:hypothetical protein
MTANIKVSVIIMVSGRHDDVSQLHKDYKAGLNAASRTHEFIYVLDGPV